MARPLPINDPEARKRYSVAEYLTEGKTPAQIRSILIERGWATTQAEAQQLVNEGRQAHRLAEAIGRGDVAAIERINAALPEGGTGRRIITVLVQIRPQDPGAVEPEGGWPYRTVRVLATERTPIETAKTRIETIIENWNRKYGTVTGATEYLSVVEA